MGETSLGMLMKEIGEALKLDNDNLDKEAYVKYTSCIHKVAGNLVLGVTLSGGNVVIGPKTTKHVKLLQQCVERVAALVSRMETRHADASVVMPANSPSPQTTPVATRPNDLTGQLTSADIGLRSPEYTHVSTPQTPNHPENHKNFRLMSLHSPVPALQPDNNPHMLSNKQSKKMSPMELARRQNQSLLTAYKARMKRLNKSDFNAFSYSLSVQRKMAENLAIAQAQEEVLAGKMKARQQRLEEEAARRFALPAGTSSAEQEQKQIYKNILLYENDVDYLREWRTKLQYNPEDPILICQLVQEVLRCSDHPLTEMLRKFQFKVYERAYPLVANRQKLIDIVKVGLPQHSWPSKEDVADLLETTNRASSPPAPEVRKRRKGRSRTGRSEGDKNDSRSEPTVDASSPNSDTGREEDKASGKRIDLDEDLHDCRSKNAYRDERCWKDPLNVETFKGSASDSNNGKEPLGVDSSQGGHLFSAQQDEEGVKEVDEGQKAHASISKDGLNEQKDVEKKDVIEEEEGEERKRETEAEDEGSDTSTLTSVSDSDSDSEEANTDKGKAVIPDVVMDTKHELKTALNKGVQLESELTLQRRQAQMLMRQVAKDYESYTDENFDDLFEDFGEEEEEVEVKADSFSEKSTSRSTTSIKDSSPASRPRSLERNANATIDRSRSMQPVHVDTPTEPPPTMFQSLPYMPASNGDNDEEDDGQIFSQLNEDAYSRHLKSISKDVHTYMDNLLTLMIVAYEALDTPVGKDQCAVALEEPFFKPIWKTLLRLFRVVYHKEELLIACVMTTYADARPVDLKISKKFWLVDDSKKDPSYEPYQSAIEKLKNLSEHYTILSKLECLVKVCRLICECVDNFYAEKDKDLTAKTAKKAPSLGADDLLPVFTYVIIRTKNPQIVSECYAMMEFIQESYMMGEEGYCLTTLRTAIAYTISLYKQIA